MKKIRDEVKEAMISAAQSTGAGNLPGAIKRLVKDLTEPKMDWREILQQQIMSTVKNDYTFIKPSRKAWPSILQELGLYDARYNFSKVGASSDEVLKQVLAINRFELKRCDWSIAQ